MRRALKALVPVLIWGAIVFYIGGRSSVPSPGIDLPLPLDKVAHFTMYGILGLLAGRAARLNRRRISWIWFVLGGLALGALDEMQQRSIPSRSADLLDWYADALGFTIAFWLVYSRIYIVRRGERG